MTSPYRSRKAYLSGFYEAVKREDAYGTAEAVPWSFYICPGFAGLLIQGRITGTQFGT
jgi:hypothetical protein